MRLIKMFGLAAVAVVAAMAFIGASSASAEKETQLCKIHTGLTCGAGNAATSIHAVLKTGTVLKFLASINVLCLGFLMEATALGLALSQDVHSLNMSFTGCGTGSTHSNVAITVPIGQQPLFMALKTGLDLGLLTVLSGQLRVVASNLGLDCLMDLENLEFEMGNNEIIAENSPVTELGSKFVCPGESLLDAELQTLENAYVLG